MDNEISRYRYMYLDVYIKLWLGSNMAFYHMLQFVAYVSYLIYMRVRHLPLKPCDAAAERLDDEGVDWGSG